MSDDIEFIGREENTLAFRKKGLGYATLSAERPDIAEGIENWLRGLQQSVECVKASGQPAASEPMLVADPADEMPRKPYSAVLLPPGPVILPEGKDAFEGWSWAPGEREWISGVWRGDIEEYRYAAKPDTEVARVNGVGFGPCPSKHGWHNPQMFTPAKVGVPEYRLLTRDEIGNRDTLHLVIEHIPSGLSAWDDTGWGGGAPNWTYRTRTPYGKLPAVKEFTFPECIPAPKDPGYGLKLDGTRVPDIDPDHEFIPEGTRVQDDEVTHWYLDDLGWRMSTCVIPQADGIAQTVQTPKGSPGNIRAYARKKYAAVHRDSGIRVGDWVLVTRAATSYERGWRNGWNSCGNMNPYIGKVCQVVADAEAAGFRLRHPVTGEAVYGFPSFILKKVDAPRCVRTLQAGDWMLGQIVRCIADPEAEYTIAGIDGNDDAVWIPAYGWRYPNQMQQEWERKAIGTGEWERCEKSITS